MTLKHPLNTYPARLVRFMELVDAVKGQTPKNTHLWQVMDSVAFEDTEAALQTVLYNVGRKSR